MTRMGALVGPVAAKNLAPDLLLASHRAGKGPQTLPRDFYVSNSQCSLVGSLA